MTADLLAAREAKERAAKSKATAEKAPETGGSSKKDAEGTDEDIVSAESFGNEEEEPGQSYDVIFLFGIRVRQWLRAISQ